MVHQQTGLPLFRRRVLGNVIVTSTIKQTLLELKGLDINVEFALLNDDYCNDKDVLNRGGEVKENLVLHNVTILYQTGRCDARQ